MGKLSLVDICKHALSFFEICLLLLALPSLEQQKPLAYPKGRDEMNAREMRSVPRSMRSEEEE
jgi:hypothetical protein